MSFENVFVIVFCAIILLFIARHKEVRRAFANVLKVCLQPFIIGTMLIFLVVYLGLHLVSIRLFQSSFLSIFFYFTSCIKFMESFDSLYKNDRLRMDSIIKFSKSILKISLYTIFLDTLFTMVINVIVAIVIASILSFIVIITKCANKDKISMESRTGFDLMIILLESLTFYIPYLTIAYYYGVANVGNPVFLVIMVSSVLCAIFIETILPILVKKNKIIKVKYIRYLFISSFFCFVPMTTLLEEVFKPSILGNISIIFASMLSLVLIHYKTSKFKLTRFKKQ